MESNNDTSFFALGGTAGVNDEVRRKEEAEAREIEAITKRTNDKVKEEGSNNQELLKSEKHAHNEAREMLQSVLDQRSSVDMDCGIVESFTDSVTKAFLGGSNISEQSREKGLKGIMEAAREHEASIQELHKQLKNRTTDLSSPASQNAIDFKANANILDAITNQIKEAQKKANDEEPGTNKTLTKQRSILQQGMNTKTEHVNKLQIPLQKIHEIKIENQKIRDTYAATEATYNETMVANASLMAEIGNEKSSLLGSKQVFLQEIDQSRAAQEAAEAKLDEITLMLTSSKTLLQRRIEHEEEAKAIRARLCKLSDDKKRLGKEIETEETIRSEARLKFEQVNVIESKIVNLTVEIDKLENEYPASRLVAATEKLESARKALEDIQKESSETANVERHQNDCGEQHRVVQDLTEEIAKTRLKTKELTETLTATDRETTTLACTLKELQHDISAKETAKRIVETTAFDNSAHQQLVRKYKVMKAARKLLDSVASLDAKLGSAMEMSKPGRAKSSAKEMATQ